MSAIAMTHPSKSTEVTVTESFRAFAMTSAPLSFSSFNRTLTLFSRGQKGMARAMAAAPTSVMELLSISRVVRAVQVSRRANTEMNEREKMELELEMRTETWEWNWH